MTSRRTILSITAAVGLLTAVRPAGAQQAKTVHRIGYLNLRSAPNELDEAFVQGLRELGYVVGRNLFIEYRWAANDMTRLKQQADELVHLGVDVIVTSSTPVVRVVKSATSTIPIVMAATADPVRTGLIASFAHPRGNVTGMSMMSPDLAGKRLQLVREIVPGAIRVALLGWQIPGSGPVGQRATEMLIAETESAGRRMGIDVTARIFADASELPAAVESIRRDRAQALIVQVNSLTYDHRAAIINLAAQLRLPDMYEVRAYVDAGGLVSYGPDLKNYFRSAAGYVDKILRGAAPGDLAVEQATKLEMVVNLRTAKARGIAIPQSVLLRADEVIQ